MPFQGATTPLNNARPSGFVPTMVSSGSGGCQGVCPGFGCATHGVQLQKRAQTGPDQIRFGKGSGAVKGPNSAKPVQFGNTVGKLLRGTGQFMSALNTPNNRRIILGAVFKYVIPAIIMGVLALLGPIGWCAMFPMMLPVWGLTAIGNAIMKKAKKNPGKNDFLTHAENISEGFGEPQKHFAKPGSFKEKWNKLIDSVKSIAEPNKNGESKAGMLEKMRITEDSKLGKMIESLVEARANFLKNRRWNPFRAIGKWMRKIPPLKPLGYISLFFSYLFFALFNKAGQKALRNVSNHLK